MELNNKERDLVIMCLLAAASNDIIYMYNAPEQTFESNEAITLAIKLRGNTPIDIDYSNDKDRDCIRAIVDESGQGVFDSNTNNLLQHFPEIKADIFTL